MCCTPPCCGPCGQCGPCGPPCCRGPELRMGILYLCDCFRFNGLQDKCPRTGCQGCSSCFTGSCGPAQYPKSFQCMSHGIDIRRVKARCPGGPATQCGSGGCCPC